MYFTQPNSYVTYPHGLAEGKNVTTWFPIKALALNLKQEGYSGTIKFKGFYKDAIGNEYQSKEVPFDLDKA